LRAPTNVDVLIHHYKIHGLELRSFPGSHGEGVTYYRDQANAGPHAENTHRVSSASCL
jgi:hypothetical protein